MNNSCIYLLALVCLAISPLALEAQLKIEELEGDLKHHQLFGITSNQEKVVAVTSFKKGDDCAGYAVELPTGASVTKITDFLKGPSYNTKGVETNHLYANGVAVGARNTTALLYGKRDDGSEFQPRLSLYRGKQLIKDLALDGRLNKGFSMVSAGIVSSSDGNFIHMAYSYANDRTTYGEIIIQAISPEGKILWNTSLERKSTKDIPHDWVVVDDGIWIGGRVGQKAMLMKIGNNGEWQVAKKVPDAFAVTRLSLAADGTGIYAAGNSYKDDRIIVTKFSSGGDLNWKTEIDKTVKKADVLYNIAAVGNDALLVFRSEKIKKGAQVSVSKLSAANGGVVDEKIIGQTTKKIAGFGLGPVTSLEVVEDRILLLYPAKNETLKGPFGIQIALMNADLELLQQDFIAGTGNRHLGTNGRTVHDGKLYLAGSLNPNFGVPNLKHNDNARVYRISVTK